MSNQLTRKLPSPHVEYALDDHISGPGMLEDISSYSFSDLAESIKENTTCAPDYFWKNIFEDLTNLTDPVVTEQYRAGLRNWIESNWFWFTESFTPRQKYILRMRLNLLSPKNEIDA